MYKTMIINSYNIVIWFRSSYTEPTRAYLKLAGRVDGLVKLD